MSSSRIEEIIEEIEEYVENCRYQPLSTTKIIVNKEELEELLRELRLKTPDEIKRYQKIIGNKDAILADAQSKANNIIEDAHKQAKALVEQTEIMKAAYAQANDTVNEANKQAQEILDSAENDAANIRSSAISYTDQILSNISTIMGNTIADVGAKYNDFASSIQSYYDLVNENRSELSPMEGAAKSPQAETSGVNDDDDDEPDDDSEE
ncbi:MAG: ATPase [Eubacteriales bacterium]|jgi:F0F1-type ATP synthase membrane subunit b/b'